MIEAEENRQQDLAFQVLAAITNARAERRTNLKVRRFNRLDDFTDLDLLREELTCTLQLLEVGRVAQVVRSIVSSAKLEFQAFGYIPERPALVFNKN